jgi:hypothetical protein
VLHGRLLDKNSHRCEPLTDLSYPVVLLQGGKGRGDRFIESLRGNLYGVLNVLKISDRNRARSKNHVQEGNIFVFCSPLRAVAILRADLRGVLSPKPVSGQRVNSDRALDTSAFTGTDLLFWNLGRDLIDSLNDASGCTVLV